MKLFRWDAPGPYTVAFSTRRGGVSEGPFASLNLGRRTGDDLGRVDENRRRLCAAVRADEARLALSFQIHSNRVNRAEAGVRGTPGDGLWTDEPGLPMVALAADCLPVALVAANGSRPSAGVVHAGRIGILGGVLQAGVQALGSRRVAAAIGPGIGPCCYEVGDDIAGAYRTAFGSDVMRRRKLDLWTAAERALRAAGCVSVERLDLCTACNPDLFFSHRRDGEPRGVQGVVAYVA